MSFRLERLPVFWRKIELEVFIRIRFDFREDALGITNPVVAFVITKSNGRFNTGMHSLTRIGNIRCEFPRRNRTNTSSGIRSPQIVGTSPLVCSGNEYGNIDLTALPYELIRTSGCSWAESSIRMTPRPYSVARFPAIQLSPDTKKGNP